MKNLNKGVKVTYIVSFILFILFILFYGLTCLDIFSLLARLNFLILCSLLFYLFYLSSIISIIFGIVNFVKNKDIIIRKRLIIMYVFLLIIAIFTFVLPSFSDYYYNSKVMKSINPLIEKIKNSEENKYVYFIKDLEKIDNSIDLSDYDDSSYITYFDNKIYVCMSDGEYKISGYENDISNKKINNINKSCEFKFSNSQAEKYAKQYYNNKYEFVYINSAEAIDDCNYDYIIVFCPDYKRVKVDTNYGTIISKIEVVNNEIVVTDNINEIISNVNETSEY